MPGNDTSRVPGENRQAAPSDQQKQQGGSGASSPSPSLSAARYVGRDLFDSAAKGCSQRSTASALEQGSASSALAQAPKAEMFDGCTSQGATADTEGP